MQDNAKMCASDFCKAIFLYSANRAFALEAFLCLQSTFWVLYKQLSASYVKCTEELNMYWESIENVASLLT